MPVSRRRFLGLGAGGAAGAALALSGCGSGGAALSGPDQVNLWTWNRSVSDKLTTLAAKKGIPGDSSKKLIYTKIGGNYKQKILTALAGKSSIPDIMGMNSDVASYFPDADVFWDLRELGAESVKSEYLDWKWQQGVAPDGRMLAFPMDAGPTALFYRADIFAKAGLPTDPQEIAAMAPDWPSYLKMATQLRKKVPGSVIVPTMSEAYGELTGQLPKLYMTKDNHYIGDQDHIKQAFDMAYKVVKDGLSANAQGPDVNAIITNGKQPCQIGAVWWGLIYPVGSAPQTSGKWRVAMPPGGPGNSGGSFLAIPKQARNPQAAMDLIKWLQSPKNQASAFGEMQLFPSTPAAYKDPALAAPQKFYGGQRTIDVFGTVAQKVPGAYLSAYDDIISTQFGNEIPNVEGGKSPEAAWKTIQENVKRELTRVGVM
ncbi:ABC transporter substrate-binding protein [Mangrovactinospora gilvigrisea]|uniref:ABC transporter substrate-binding protein n=1 Tax=Mangrovactinospora gilvigrisea TaxID=1428644 RepID=A0A1J7BG09_9ACTN|nr:extracellular solute-binding protein [Mangrovactinospora gilvigrisea]OIV37611.1 ABC transporter substrate-binding protein [Mangrovactinospora gilvigrisea]